VKPGKRLEPMIDALTKLVVVDVETGAPLLVEVM
jgi:hypothetical protein